MKKMLILTSALCGMGFAAQAQNQEVNVVSWGGAYERSQVEAYNIPFAKETGIKVNMLAADNPATPLKAQVEANNITGDVFRWGLIMAGAVSAAIPVMILYYLVREFVWRWRDKHYQGSGFPA